MTDLTLEQRMQYAIILGGTMNESWRPVINDAVEVAEAYAAEQTAELRAELDSLIAAWTEERLDAQETAIELRAQVAACLPVIAAHAWMTVEEHDAAMAAQVKAVLAIIDAVGNPDWQTEAACDRIRAAVVVYREEGR